MPKPRIFCPHCLQATPGKSYFEHGKRDLGSRYYLKDYLGYEFIFYTRRRECKICGLIYETTEVPSVHFNVIIEALIDNKLRMLECSECRGTPEKCDVCNGDGLTICDECDGIGSQENGILCSECNGTGLQECDFCSGTGRFCDYCNNVGFIIEKSE